eukprot:gene5312-6617_t
MDELEKSIILSSTENSENSNNNNFNRKDQRLKWATKDNSEKQCKKGCCSSSSIQTSEQPTVIEKIDLPPQPLASDEISAPKLNNCKKGCCGTELPSLSTSNTPTVQIFTKITDEDPCKKKGCCSSKQSETTSSVTTSTNILVAKEVDPCKKGCCDGKLKTTTPTKPVPSIKMKSGDPCSKACCDSSKPTATFTSRKDEIFTFDSKSNKPTIRRTYCCEICIDGCCKQGCCKDKCCVSYSVKVGQAKISKKKTVFASLLYRSCNSFCGIRFGFITGNGNENDDNETIDNLIGIENGNRMDDLYDENNDETSVDIPKGEEKMLYLGVTGMTCADCANTLDEKVTSLRGVSSINTSLFTEKAEIKYYPNLISPTDIINVVNSLGFVATEQGEPNSTVLSISFNSSSIGIKSDSIVELIKSISGVDNVKQFGSTPNSNDSDVSISLLNDSSSIRFDISYNPDEIGARNLLEEISLKSGYNAQLVKPSSTGTNGQSDHVRGLRNLFLFSLLFSLPVFIIAFIIPSSKNADSKFEKEIANGFTVKMLVLWILTTPIQVIVGKPLYISAWKTLYYAKKASMDLLIVISSTTAYVYSIISIILNLSSSTYRGPVFFETSAILLTLIILGRYLESVAKGHASDVLSKLLLLQTPTAILIDNTENGQLETEIDIDLVQKGDILKVLPWTKVPIDGILINNDQEKRNHNSVVKIDESLITGESKSVTKKMGDLVYGGSMNQHSPFHLRVSTHPNQSTIANIVKLVEEAQSSKPPFQNFADKIAAYFVPSIVGLALVVFIIWFSLAHENIVSIDSSKMTGAFTFALLFSMSVLVISCPCAVSLATPTAIMVGSGVAAKNGILFKGGDILETCHLIETVVFDKTGTLTRGHPTVTDYKNIDPNKVPDKDFFFYLGSAELGSEHLLAKVLTKFSQSRLESSINGEVIQLENPTNVETVPGKGIKCLVNSKSVVIGNQSFLAHELEIVKENLFSQPLINETQELESMGKTVVWIAIDGQLTGYIAIFDDIKEESYQIVQYLQDRMNIQVWMISGDNRLAVEHIAKKLNIKHYVSEATPQEKSDYIIKLQQNGSGNNKKPKTIVAMVGDGINDSLALVNSDVGFSIASGNDIAIEAADIVLMRNDLRDIITAIDLSRSTFNRIKMNLGWAFIYNLFGIPLAAGLLYPFVNFSIPPAFAGLSEILSSLPVMAKSSRSKRIQRNNKILREKLSVYEQKKLESITQKLNEHLDSQTVSVNEFNVPPELSNNKDNLDLETINPPLISKKKKNNNSMDVEEEEEVEEDDDMLDVSNKKVSKTTTANRKKTMNKYAKAYVKKVVAFKTVGKKKRIPMI